MNETITPQAVNESSRHYIGWGVVAAAFTGVMVSFAPIVIRQSSLAQDSDAGVYRSGKPKEMQRLINQMRSKIEPQSRARTGIFAPALTHDRPKTVDVRLVVRYLTEHACLYNRLCGKNLTVPSPIMKDRQNPIVFLCNLCERTSFRKSRGKGFIDDDIFPCAQSGGGERKMALIGAGDHDQIDIRMGRHFPGGTDEDAGILCFHDLSFAGPYYIQRQTRHRLDQWGMEGFSGKAVANNPTRIVLSFPLIHSE
jgi:hypothetical protein